MGTTQENKYIVIEWDAHTRTYSGGGGVQSNKPGGGGGRGWAEGVGVGVVAGVFVNFRSI